MRTTDFDVCQDCLIAIANDDYTGMDDETARDVSHGIEALQIIEDGYLTAGGEELGFSTRPCECCHCRYHGDRFRVTMVHNRRYDT